MDISNASLLDEGTAAGEALTLAHRALKGKRNKCLVSKNCHPQTRSILETRAAPLGIQLESFDEANTAEIDADVFAIIIQYPDTYGTVSDLTGL